MKGAGTGLAPGLGLAGREARVARGLLLGGEGRLPLGLLGGLPDEVRRGTLAGRQGFRFALGLGGVTGDVPFGDPHVAGLDDGLPRSLPRENRRIISRRARPEPGKGRLPRQGDRLEAIGELIGFELTHVDSLCAPRLGRVARNR